MKITSLIFGSVVVAGVMAFTNPSKERYSEYVSEELTEASKEIVCSLDFPIPNYKQICEFATPFGKPAIKKAIQPLVENYSKHQNYVLFSFYVLELPDRKITTVGALGNFYMLK
jgi:hypothetical protein